MNDFGKIFILLGIVLIVVGVAWRWIGKLPGDILIKKGNVTFFFPIVTCIVISVILSLLFYLFGRFR